MNINMSEILKCLNYKYGLHFDSDFYNHFPELDSKFDINKVIKAIKKLQQFFAKRFKIIYTKTPSNFQDLIKIIYQLSLKISEIEDQKYYKDCLIHEKCSIISNYNYYTTVLFLLCYANKKEEELDNFLTPNEAIEEIFEQILINKFSAIFN